MPVPGVRRIVYPGGDYRPSRDVAPMNDEHSPDRLPEHPTITVQHPSGEGWSDAVDEICRYNAVSPEDAALHLERLLLEPGLRRTEDAVFSATVLGVKVKLVKVR